MGRSSERPDHEETEGQRGRYDDAQEGFRAQRTRIETAANHFAYTVEQFHQIENEFLALIDEMRRTQTKQIPNLAHLEGLRIRLLMSLDEDYRHAVNQVADTMLASIGLIVPPPENETP